MLTTFVLVSCYKYRTAAAPIKPAPPVTKMVEFLKRIISIVAQTNGRPISDIHRSCFLPPFQQAARRHSTRCTPCEEQSLPGTLCASPAVALESEQNGSPRQEPRASRYRAKRNPCQAVQQRECRDSDIPDLRR